MPAIANNEKMQPSCRLRVLTWQISRGNRLIQRLSLATTILLCELRGPALIVPSKTGVMHRNQTGGHACYQSELEGYLVPIAGDSQEIVDRLCSHLTGSKWGGWCAYGIDDETADETDEVLTESARREEIKVDRDKLGESWESWIHVNIQCQLLSLIENSNSISAILTWPNSD